jgi:hypothetical protein
MHFKNWFSKDNVVLFGLFSILFCNVRFFIAVNKFGLSFISVGNIIANLFLLLLIMFVILCNYNVLKFKNMISVNMIALLGFIVTFFCAVEFLPIQSYPHLSLEQIDNVLTRIYLFGFTTLVISIIEVVLNKRLSLKYMQSNLLENSLAHSIFLKLGLLLSFLLFSASIYLIQASSLKHSL